MSVNHTRAKILFCNIKRNHELGRKERLHYSACSWHESIEKARIVSRISMETQVLEGTEPQGLFLLRVPTSFICCTAFRRLETKVPVSTLRSS